LHRRFQFLALRALRITGDVITTPFSFVATSNAIVLAGGTPVFADIDPHNLNLCPKAVEASITDRTQAILPVHSYGIPCDVDALQEIADRHGLALIYDAAHCFDVRVNNRSLLDYGTCSVVSFHATKVFNTFEGGGIICSDQSLQATLEQMLNNGIVDEVTVASVGLNAKMSELHAAVGLASLPKVSEKIAMRLAVADRYLEAFSDVKGLRCVQPPSDVAHNGYMFPIMVEPDYPVERDTLYETLKQHGIFARRYFFPCIADLPTFRSLPSASSDSLAIARRAANTVLCLPLFPSLDLVNQDRIIEIVRHPLG
jgi:dTDP-4-amino-4,6-dideoxy-D-glucose transaminase